MPILHRFKLMTSNGFGILLILLEGLRIDIAQTRENLEQTTGKIQKEQIN